MLDFLRLTLKLVSRGGQIFVELIPLDQVYVRLSHRTIQMEEFVFPLMEG